MKSINVFIRFLLFGVGFFGASFLFTSSASAANQSAIESIRFLNSSVIKVDFTGDWSSTLVDSNTNDSTFEYKINKSSSGHSCDGTIRLYKVDGASNLLEYISLLEGREGQASNKSVAVDVDVPPNCDPIDGGGEIEMIAADFQKAKHFYKYENSSKIVRVADINDTYDRSEQYPNIYFRTDDGPFGSKACVDFIELTSTGTFRLYDISPDGDGGDNFASSTPSELLANCLYNDQKGDEDHVYGYLGHPPAARNNTLPLGNASAAPANINEISDEERAEMEQNAANATDPEESCENDGGDLSFIICPILRAADEIVNYLNGLMEKLLFLPESYTEGTDLETTWARIRNLAYALLVPIMMVMVIGTALGFDFVSAYTVKKAMPRMVIAIIFIAVSFSLLQFLVTLTNEIGMGSYGFITGVVSPNEPITLSSLFNSNAGTDTLTIFIGAIGVGAIAAFGSIGILLSYAFITIIALLVAVFLLALRQMLIITLMIVAPIAILSWIFPGNDKFWKVWWGAFWKLLMLYPLIMILIAGGHIFAYIVHDAPVDGLMQTGLKLLGFVAPYFFIPAMFKFAGGVFGTVTGMVNDKSRGLFDRQKRYRGQKMSQNWGKTRNYQRFSDKNRLGRGVSTLLGAGANPRDMMRGPKGVRRGARTGRTLQGAENLKEDATFQAHQNESEFLLALANEDLAKQKQAQAQQNYEAKAADYANKRQQYGEDSQEARAAAADAAKAQQGVRAYQAGLENASGVKTRRSSGTRLAALDALSKTGYEFSPGERGYTELQSTVKSIVGDDSLAQMSAMDQMQFNSKGAGRLDLAGINHAAGQDAKTGLRKLSNSQRGQGKVDTYHGGAEAWLGASAVGADGKTAKTSDEMAQGISQSLANEQTDVDSVAEYYSMLQLDKMYANDANKLEIQKQLDAIQHASNDPVLQQRIQQENERIARERPYGQNDPRLGLGDDGS